MAKHTAPTSEIVTPINGHKVVIKEWITGRDTEWIQSAIFEGVTAKPTMDGGVQFGNFDVAKTALMNHRTLQAWVVSVDGIQGNDNILETLRDMHAEDYDYVVAEVTERSKKKQVSVPSSSV